MKKIIINGGKRLSGKIKIDGSKNAALALIPASLLTKDVVTLENVPDISDIHEMLDILNILNVSYEFIDNKLTIDSSRIINTPLIKKNIEKIRASYYFMGALLSLFQNVQIIAPGGCKIGNRPINYHLNGFRKMGINVNEMDNVFNMSYVILNNTTIKLPFPSVGATINLVLAAVKSDNIIIIDNISCEPEVNQVIDFLKSCGARIKKIGHNTLIIIGTAKLKGTTFKVMNDRIEAGTYCILAALLGDNLLIEGVNKDHLNSLFTILDKVNADYFIKDNIAHFNKSNLNNPFEIETSPFPLFPTDLQQPICVLGSFLPGQSIIYENIYEDRIAHIKELNKMGADIKIFQNKIIINGGTPLFSNKLKAKDLRGGAALIIAALSAKGTSLIEGVNYIERGYPNIIQKLSNVGADIKMEDS